jgi:hypothetical protein
MSTPRYFVRLQLVEQTGFDDDNPQTIVMDAKIISPPVESRSAASVIFNSVQNLVSISKNMKDYL